MKRLIKLLMAIRTIVPLNNLATVFAFAAMLLTTTISYAQINQTVTPIKEVPAIKKPVTNTEIKKGNTVPQPTREIDKKFGKYLVVTPTPGKDLTVVIDTILDNSTASENKYIVHFTLINSGTEDIDIIGVVMQGKLSTGQPGAGVTLSTGILQPSRWVSGTIGSSSKELYTSGNPYKYILTADAFNKIAETNEKNNTAEATIIGHLEPPPPLCDPAKNPDITITNLSVTKFVAQPKRVEFSYTVKNIGQGYVTLSQISAEGIIRKLNGEIVSTAQTCKCMKSLQMPKILKPNESYTFVNDEFPYSYCSLDGLESGQHYTLILTLSSTCPESGTSNNSKFVQFTTQ